MRKKTSPNLQGIFVNKFLMIINLTHIQCEDKCCTDRIIVVCLLAYMVMLEFGMFVNMFRQFIIEILVILKI